MDACLLPTPTRKRRKKRRRRARARVTAEMVVLNRELTDAITHTVTFAQRAVADGPIVSSRYRR